MRDNSKDSTIERNYIRNWQHLCEEYETVKAHKHPKFRFVTDFYKHHKTHRQVFLKYYHRYKASGNGRDLLPRCRGPKWQARRGITLVEDLVLQQRRLGNNRYEIYAILLPQLKDECPSPSTIYRITRRYDLNRLKPKMKENHRKIIKQKAGELGHIDCHHLSRDLFPAESKRHYLVGLVDDCTRLAWAEVVSDITSLSVMFTSLRIINLLNSRYQIQFAEMMSDNGSEFASKKNLVGHPFERMLQELGIRHRYTRPYRPQTNGKVERFWRTLNDDLIDDTVFESLDEFKQQLELYLLYYNEHRPHQGIGAKTPLEMRKKLSAKE